jgi:hypothetical protein
VQAVAKYSTSNVLGRDWREVASDLPGHSKQECKEFYRLADTVTELTIVFIRVIFLGSPAFRSSLVLTKVTDSRILHDLFTIVHLMSPHPPPLRPCPQPPRSHK